MVVGFGLAVLWWLAPCRNVTEEAQGICLVAAFLVLTSMRQRTLGKGVRLLQVASQHLCLPQTAMTERLKVRHFHGSSLCRRLREQRYGVSDAPAQGIRCAQGCSHPGE